MSDSDNSNNSDSDSVMSIRGDTSFYGDELPDQVELVHEETGDRQVLGRDPKGSAGAIPAVYVAERGDRHHREIGCPEFACELADGPGGFAVVRASRSIRQMFPACERCGGDGE